MERADMVCNAECDTGVGMTVVRERVIQLHPLCGGTLCGPTIEVLSCPPTKSCLLASPQHTRLTLFVAGLDAETYVDNKAAVHAAVKRYVATALEGTTALFQLKLRSLSTDATPTEPSLRRRRAIAPADTDSELEVDVITDRASVSNDAVATALRAANSAALERLLQAALPVGAVTDLFTRIAACSSTAGGCAATACGWVLNSCGDAEWCGECGLNGECGGHALARCINDGDCSHLEDAVDEKGTLDGCLKDTSQL
jgi:hypothetical protein